MICMKCMNLIMNMQQSYADDLERQKKRAIWMLDPYGGVGTSTTRPSDAYYS